MVPIETQGLKRGQVVSYGDQANPRHTAVVIESEGSSPYGQRCVFEDSFVMTTVSTTAIEGPGGWHLEDEIRTAEEVDALELRAFEKRERQKRESEQAEEERKATIERGRELARRIVPAWARAYIAAEYEVDDCDSMSDYFNTKTTKRMLLAFSRHTRDLFPELRKAAALFDELTGIDFQEHREKYSMGSGFYLKAGSTYSTGWRVKKWQLRSATDTDLAALLGKGDYLPALEQPAAVLDSARASMTVNEQLNGVEIRFASKPSEETRDQLKRAGFRWSRGQGLWYARRSDATEAAARLICGC